MLTLIFDIDSEFSKLRRLYESRSSSAVRNGSLKNGHEALSEAEVYDADSKLAAKSTANGAIVEDEVQGPPVVNERHRHRYEVDPDYVDQLTKAGLHFVGKDDKGERMEILELPDHKWFVGVQYHPEYLSRVLQPSKPYLGR